MKIKGRKLSWTGVVTILVPVIGPYLLGYIPLFRWLGVDSPSTYPVLLQWLQGLFFSLTCALTLFVFLLAVAVLCTVFATIFPKEKRNVGS